MNSTKHQKLSLKERVIIETLLKENKSQAYVAKSLSRARSTISRELRKWGVNYREEYSADIAYWSAKDYYLNKRNRDKISTHKRLKIYVYKGLLKQWTHEQIAGRIKVQYPNDPIMIISHEAIYRHIYLTPQGALNKKLIKLLVRKKTRRWPLKKRRGTGSKIINQV